MCLYEMARERDVWIIDDAVEVLHKLGVDNLLKTSNKLFTNFIENIVRRKMCDFSVSSLKELHELKFMLLLKLKFRNLGLRGDESLPESEALVKFCCISMRSGTCSEIRSYFPIFGDLLMKCLLFMDQRQYNITAMYLLKECKSKLLETLSLTFPSSRETELLQISSHANNILANCVILESVLESMRLAPSVDNEVYEFLNDETLCKAVIKLTNCGLSDVDLHMLTLLIPKLGFFNDTIFSDVYSDIFNPSKYWPNDSTKTMWNLLVLCALAEHFFPISSINDRFVNLISNDCLWKLFQEGLIHANPTVRKQALYLMKRIVECVSHHKLLVDTGNDAQSLFWWKPCLQDELSSMWEKYFVVLETLEETQVHLVMPVMKIVDELILKCAILTSNSLTNLHITWVLCIFGRILQHENDVVVKWGIINVNWHKLNYFLGDNEFTSKVLIMFVEALNNSALYASSQDDHSAFNVKVAIQDMLTAVTLLPSHKAQGILNDILRVANKIQWGPVPLFYFCYALAGVPGNQTKVLNCESVFKLEEFIRNALANQNVFIRGAVQCFLIQAITNLLRPNSKDIQLIAVANFLGSFQSSESLKRGTSSWEVVVTWLKMFVESDVTQNFLARSLIRITSSELEDLHIAETFLARMMVLFWDAGCVPLPFDSECSVIRKPILKLVDNFQAADKRLYANVQVQESSLQLLVSLLEESEHQKPSLDDHVRNTVLSIVGMCVSGVVVFVLRRLVSVTHLADYERVNFLVCALKTFSKSLELLPLLYKEAELLHTTATNILFRDEPPIRKYFASHVLVWTSKLGQGNPEKTVLKTMLEEGCEKFLTKMVSEGMLKYAPVRDESCGQLTRDLNTTWGRVVSGYIHNVWSVLAALLQMDHCAAGSKSHLAASSVIDAALECVHLGGKDILPPVLEVVGCFLSLTTPETLESISKLLSHCWKAMFELRKTEIFWQAFRSFVNATFTESALKNSLLVPLLLKYFHDILEHGDNVPKLPNVLLEQLDREVRHTSIHFLDPYVEVLAEALIFGPIHRKDLRVVNETCDYIESLGVQLSVNVLLESDCQVNNKVRALAVGLFLRLVSLPDGHQMAFRVMEYLRERDRFASARKPFYHKDSQLHRLKNRVLQVLLLLQPILSLDQSQTMVTWLCDCLLSDNPQPSVRYQQEWMLVLILDKYPQLCDSLWAITEQALETRPGSMCSFISVLFHLAYRVSHSQEQFIDRVMQQILPCTTGHHFLVRTYAKVALTKLLELCKEQQFACLLSKYSVVASALHLKLEQGNSVRMLNKLLNEFYFGAFNPFHHYSVETIFYDLPRLANVTQEEWIPIKLFESLSQFPANTVPLKNPENSLSQFSAADWIVKSTAHDENGSTAQAQVAVQKKMVPWKSMIPAQEDSGRKRVAGDMVVVASLIDRSPNLGGLSRTCEVFGVSQYVLGSLKYVEDKQFQNLSVSADKWLNMLEVKPHMLFQYLQSMKQDGYLVVGVEQTASSIRLDKMKFPKKSLLLLGNEKEGIPANLLPFMDVCVEVPQCGLTRSLNVHVTGAIFIWEYYQQHLLNI